jgi:stress response protein YsnF
MGVIEKDRILQLRGEDLYDSDGYKIGSIEEIYLDDATDANAGAALDGPAISEEAHEVVLHEEEVVADKRVVPRERVRLDKDVEIDERTVSEEVRREEIELDDAGGSSECA